MTAVDLYHGTLRSIGKWFGSVLAVLSFLALICILADWIGRLGWGYSWWSLPFAVAMLAVGLSLRWFFLAWQNHEKLN